MKVTKTKAQRILAVMRNAKNHGKTASEIAAAADVDHNHVYVFEALVADGHLKRSGGDARCLEPFDKKYRGGRGTTYSPGRNFDVPLPGRAAPAKPAKATRTTKKVQATRTARSARPTRSAKAVAAEAAAIGGETPGEAAVGNTVVLEIPATTQA